MFSRYPTAALAVLIATLIGPPPTTWAQSSGRPSPRSTAGEAPIALPTDPRAWHNSPPLSLESLSGKGVVFYFFEEECPRCAANWPAVQQLANEYDGKPIVFIAVNSGTEPRVLKRYLAQQRVKWPVIHDYDRSLENVMGVPKLTLEGEVFAVKYVSGAGSLADGKGADFAATAEAALKGAEWRVDPASLPPKLLVAWKAIELGDFSSAARAVTQAADSKDKSIKAGAEKLLSAVEEEVKAEATEAQQALSDGEDWKAYRTLTTISERYDGYDLPLIERAESKSKELSKSTKVKGELSAARLLDKAIALGSKGTAGAIKRAKGQLQHLIANHPDTEAAVRAQDILANVK